MELCIVVREATFTETFASLFLFDTLTLKS